MRARLPSLVFALGLILLGIALRAEGLLVAYVDNTAGGIVRIDLGPDGRPIGPAPVVVFQSLDFITAHKLRVSPDGRVAALAAEIEDGPNLALIDLTAPTTSAPRLLSLGYVPEEHRFAANRLYVGGTDGHLVSLDPATGHILHHWNSRRDLRPAGHKPEDFLAFEPEGVLLVTHQKDGKDNRRGSRIAALRLDNLRLIGDLRLPRNLPDLHLSDKEAGPSPEILRADPATNTLVITLDLYGALAFADLDAALQGRLANYAIIPASADGRWGHAFPDRLILARVGDRTLAVVSNATQDGGLKVFDVGARTALAFFPVEAGCDHPVLVHEGKTVATVVAGKRKRVVGRELENIVTPGTDLLLLHLDRVDEIEPMSLLRASLGGPVAHVAAIPGRPDLVAATRLSPAAVVICSAHDGRILTKIPLPGRPVALQTLPAPVPKR
jgi:hypothetical protein